MALEDEEWRVLAEEAAQEKDPNQLLEIIQSLNRALAEREIHLKPKRENNGLK